MTLIVEDGSGKTDSESYCSVAFASAYHLARGNTAWAELSDDAEREKKLRIATDYMIAQYRMRWAGYRTSSNQALDWPRYDIPMKDAPGGSGYAYYPSGIVPDEVQRACAELALRAIDGALAPDIGRLKSRTKVGPLEVEYAAGAPAYTQFRAVDNLLAPFMGGSGGNLSLSLVRA